MSWIGDGWCDNGIVYHVDCTQCEHFTNAEGVFDGGDCDDGNLVFEASIPFQNIYRQNHSEDSDASNSSN